MDGELVDHAAAVDANAAAADAGTHAATPIAGTHAAALDAIASAAADGTTANAVDVICGLVSGKGRSHVVGRSEADMDIRALERCVGHP
jgi:hypothetical protein